MLMRYDRTANPRSAGKTTPSMLTTGLLNRYVVRHVWCDTMIAWYDAMVRQQGVGRGARSSK